MNNCFPPRTDVGSEHARDGFRRRARGRRRGVALVLVLAFLVIITGLVIAFFASVTTELSSAKGYEGEAVARQLGDSAVQSVMAAIGQATDTHNAALHPGGPVAWASQPGMIWNYSSSATPAVAYKLYSSDNMVVTQMPFDSSSDVGTGWNIQPALYTDLNSPVKTAAGAMAFPIVDGNSMKTMMLDGVNALTYSSDGTTQDVAGFSVDPSKVSYTSGTTPTPTNNPVPMPTKWLYVLKNGVMTAPDPATSASAMTKAAFTTSPISKQPTAANPIVGRVAFWTDDETCKVNINTASEGAYWDTPRGKSTTDQSYGYAQPAQHEYQRYPGHPAGVSLSTIFPGLTAESIYGIVPRVVGGGSLGGTYRVTNGTLPLVTDSDRLYASVDELIFSPPATGTSRTENAIPTPTPVASDPDASKRKRVIDQKKFFLTARSVAPELNLYDLPRVSCWPIYALSSSGNASSYDLTHTTAFDRLIGTCSSAGLDTYSNPYPYFFQRKDYSSSTGDIGIARNQQLYTYLKTLTTLASPGFATSLSTKYPSDREQILTEMFDYVRSTNLTDDNLASAAQYTPAKGKQGHGFVAPTIYTAPGGAVTQGFGRTYTLSEFGIGFICNATAKSAPTASVPNPTDDYGSNDPTTNKVLSGTALATGEKYIQAIIVLELFSPMQGWTPIQPDMQVEIKHLDNLKVTDSSGTVLSLGLPADEFVPYTADSTNLWSGIASGGNANWRYCLLGKGLRPIVNPPTVNLPGDTGSLYPFIGVPIKIKAPVTGGTMAFSGAGNIEVRIYSGATPLGTAAAPPLAATQMQLININLPPTTLPVPGLVNMGTTGYFHSTVKENWWSFPKAVSYMTIPPVTPAPTPATSTGGRLATLGDPSWSGSSISSGAFFFHNQFNSPQTTYDFDVVRTVRPAHGDYRLVAGVTTVDSSVFVPHPDYYDSTKFFVSNLSNSVAPGQEQGFDNKGKYFSNLLYSYVPDIPSNATQTPETMHTGDVDSGLPMTVDGAFINKPDEGTIRVDNDPNNIAYYADPTVQNAIGPTFFTPNRIMISSGMFGSLPTGIKSNPPIPWQTLLFRPQSSHPQSATVPPFDAVAGKVASRPGMPPDHLFMDLFWMPVVEPYAISDRFSTAGKINMNYQIAPFTYITRNTALRALLKNERVAAIPNGSGIPNSTALTGYPDFKSNWKVLFPATSPQTDIRLKIDAYQTLSQFAYNFSKGQLFRSASQICDLYIVPSGQTAGAMDSFWMDGTYPSATGHIATGDNLRERIYTTLYPRLTTKSNTFTVHFHAEALKQTPDSATAGIWNETKDAVTGDYRGLSVIERYIDPTDTHIPDYAPVNGADPTTITPALNSLYRWRIVENHRFAP